MNRLSDEEYVRQFLQQVALERSESPLPHLGARCANGWTDDCWWLKPFARESHSCLLCSLVRPLRVTHSIPCQSAINLIGDMEAAVTAFARHNPEHDFPNVIIWVNHDRQRHANNLILALKSFITMTGWSVENGFMQFAQSSLVDTRYNVDLHLWLERADFMGGTHFCFTPIDCHPEHTLTLRTLFASRPDHHP